MEYSLITVIDYGDSMCRDVGMIISDRPGKIILDRNIISSPYIHDIFNKWYETNKYNIAFINYSNEDSEDCKSYAGCFDDSFENLQDVLNFTFKLW